MAKATANKHQAPPPPPVVTGITLELTVEEAEILFYVTGKVGGSIDGPRGVISDGPDGRSINTVLEKALGEAGLRGHDLYNKLRRKYSIKESPGMTLEKDRRPLPF